MALFPLPMVAADIEFDPHFLDPVAADAALADLSAAIAWEQHRLRLFGREHLTPRLCCWLGDADASYTYSRTRFLPRPWTTGLLGLKAKVEQASGGRFNSVLANQYRNGADSMGWHADDEPELGRQPLIASVSLGGSRRFLLRSSSHPRQRSELLLTHGSLLLMRGDTQARYQHAVPRSSKPCAARINLTFRRILTPTAATAS